MPKIIDPQKKLEAIEAAMNSDSKSVKAIAIAHHVSPESLRRWIKEIDLKNKTTKVKTKKRKYKPRIIKGTSQLVSVPNFHPASGAVIQLALAYLEYISKFGGL